LKPLVSCNELAALLGVSRVTVWRLSRDGLLHVSFRRGPTPAAEVEAYTERARAEAERIRAVLGHAVFRFRGAR
jgi:predicted DNA-binding transcriptional regulator AlpA